MQISDGPASFDVEEAEVRRLIRVQALKQPGVPAEEGLWQWPDVRENDRAAVREYWDALQQDNTPAYEITFWGPRAVLEPLSTTIGEAPDEVDGVGWLRVLLELVEQQGLQWREHIDPESGYPFREHDDGMPPVPLSKLRAAKPEQMLGHSPFGDRSNLTLAFRGSDDVAILLEVVAERVPGFADVQIRLIANGTEYEWKLANGKVALSYARGLGADA
ncbi:MULTISPECIES: hypothetical protein [Bacteria]